MKQFFVILILFVLIIAPSLVSADTLGPGSPTTIAENQSVGSTFSLDYSSLQFSKNNYAQEAL